MSFRLLVYFRGRVLDDRGTPLRCRHLTRELAGRAELQVHLLSADDPGRISEELPDVEHTLLADRRRPDITLRSAVDRFRPHLVYGQTHKSLADLASLRAEPRPLRVADLHGDLPRWRLEQHWRPWAWRLYWYLRGRLDERLHLAAMDGFTVVGETLAGRIRRTGKPVEVLWGGVDTARFRPPEKPAEDSRAGLRVAYAGGFRTYHGIETLLRAVQQALASDPAFHLTLIGDIGESPAARRLAETALGNHVTIAGKMAYERIPELLGRADVLVIPRAATGTARSTYPSKLSEYLALGKALVVTDVGEVGRVVEHGKTALLVPPGSAAAMAAALLSLRDDGLRRRLGRAARSLAVERLSWPQIGDRLLAFLENLRGTAC